MSTPLPVPGLRGVRRRARRVVVDVVETALEYRLVGLAAEAAFFSLLSLPPLLFGLAGAIGFVVQALDVVEIAELRGQILQLVSTFVTPDVVGQVIAPTLDDVLGNGRADIVSVGFLLALWSGSRAASVLIDAIAIVYGRARRRGILRTRVLSLGIYAAFLVLGGTLLPLLMAGPRIIRRLLPEPAKWVAGGYWPLVLTATLFLVTTVFHRTVPGRTRWRADLPGSALTMVLWLAGSTLLRWSLGASVGTSSIYGPLAAPIALLAWFWLVSFSLLLGAAVNAALVRAWPRIARARSPLA